MITRPPINMIARIASTTIINPDSTTEEFAYNSQGNVTKVTDERGEFHDV